MPLQETIKRVCLGFIQVLHVHHYFQLMWQMSHYYWSALEKSVILPAIVKTNNFFIPATFPLSRLSLYLLVWCCPLFKAIHSEQLLERIQTDHHSEIVFNKLFEWSYLCHLIFNISASAYLTNTRQHPLAMPVFNNFGLFSGKCVQSLNFCWLNISGSNISGSNV